MPVYVVTGKLGSGKTLATVGKIRDYIKEGRKVATNIDLNLEHLTNPYKKHCEVYRVPDKPLEQDFDSIGLGYDGDYRGEEFNGGLFLDECGTWFNSRNWNDKGRQAVIDFFIHARKKRWDIYLIIQDLEVMDKQARVMFAEHVVECKRTDRISIPFVSAIYKLFSDKTLPLPKVHMGFVRYGTHQGALVVDRWVYRGTDLYNGYDTEQIFAERTNEVYQYLPPYLVKGRYTNFKMELKNAIKNIKIKSLHFFWGGALMAATVTNAAITQLPGEPKKGLVGCNKTYEELYGSCDAPNVLLKDKERVKELLQNGDITQKEENTDHKGSAKEITPIYITGSVKSSKGFDYLFSKGGEPYYPDLLGLRVRWLSACRALVGKETVTCNPSAQDDYEDYYDSIVD